LVTAGFDHRIDIHQRYTHRQIKPVIDGLKARIAELEAALKAERGRHN
jgi:hypothetical protein